MHLDLHGSRNCCRVHECRVTAHCSTTKTCPANPPYPALLSPPSAGFNWRGIETHYPVEKLAQLPSGRRKKLPKVQYDFEQEETPLYGELMRKRRQAAVKAAFMRCWRSYKERAWTKDELRPISGGSARTFGGWGATLVDSLDTLWIMDLKAEFREAVDAVTEIDFKPGDGEVNMFEITIRYLGGLLAAYDLTDCKDSRLLEKAMELGDMIYASFDTPSRTPITRWNAKKASNGEKQTAAANAIIAELASFSMEFTRLSQLTGDMRYYDAVTRVTAILSSQQNATKLPGLWPVGINAQTPDLTYDTQFSLGAMADSAYEYLGKTYQLLHGVGSDAAQYKKMYNYAIDSVIKYLLFRPMIPDEQADILMPTVVRATSPSSVSQDHTAQHLACFVGGMLALGGRLAQNTTHVAYGRRVTDACIWTYRNAPHSIMPEIFTMAACPTHSACAYNASHPSQQHPGFARVSDARYMLRPEAIESVFYLYRITGDASYQDIAWDMFQAIDSQSRTAYANAAIRDVMRDDGVKEDKMESFWLSETLKYFYLVFSEPGFMSLDEWVFNTEAHPFRLGTS
ncbi:glycoside hydrolase family 47 protein [Trematosphaeria pertusa]|uniref:alpha-1,2-Mannosidase n=1 Tax=Trematosphaeria pertusa TaxID=390896 RepID=A0A6A6IEI9_9PLEO|nr:glycoside hydrolase family 47 protein [Trematosphaeria pertusa]KAF2247960.1 glycoside hydrolase family 47 protein [Trematosphaeria pertusa]